MLLYIWYSCACVRIGQESIKFPPVYPSARSFVANIQCRYLIGNIDHHFSWLMLQLGPKNPSSSRYCKLVRTCQTWNDEEASKLTKRSKYFAFLQGFWSGFWCPVLSGGHKNSNYIYSADTNLTPPSPILTNSRVNYLFFHDWSFDASL